jgi:hypothetical protein
MLKGPTPTAVATAAVVLVVVAVSVVTVVTDVCVDTVSETVSVGEYNAEITVTVVAEGLTDTVPRNTPRQLQALTYASSSEQAACA